MKTCSKAAGAFNRPVRSVVASLGAVCLAGALSVVTAAGAGAAVLPGGQYGGPGHGGPPGGGQWGHWARPVVGTVVTPPAGTAPTTFTMNVKGTGGTTTLVTVDISTTTTLREPGYSSAALANILAGDQVSVVGTQGATSTLDATSVTLPEVWEAGTVVTPPGSSAPTTFTMNVKGMGGTTTLVTVAVSSTTTVREPGYSTTALANIVAGDQVNVAGTQGGATSVAATWVTLPEVWEAGTVVTPPASSAPTTFTMNVKGMGGTTTLVTVDVSTTTTLRQPGYSTTALANILAGDQVSVMGTQAGTSTVAATSVTLPEVREMGTVVTPPGTTAPTTFTMNVKGMGGTTTLITVDVSTSTVLRQWGNSSPALSAIVANADVSVIATQGGATTLNATQVTLASTGNGHGQGGGFRHGHHHHG